MKLEVKEGIVERLLPWLVLSYCVLATNSAFAGKLDDFEEAAKNEERNQSGGSVVHTGSSVNDSDDESFFDLFFEDFFGELFVDLTSAVVDAVVFGGGRNSNEYVRLTFNSSPNRQSNTSAFLPFARFDSDYQAAESDITADRFTALFGYGAWALKVEQFDLEEESPADKLRFQKIMGYYRMSDPNQRLQIAFGVGQSRFIGNEEDIGSAFAIPVTVGISDQFQLEFHPSWNHNFENTREELDLGLLWKSGHVGLKFGYRTQQTGGASIEGPYAGLSFFY